jgi:anti-sigma factor RsiW
MDAYLDGELDLVRSLEFEQHLKECSVCPQAFERRRSLVTAMKTMPLSYHAPAGLEQEIRTAIRREAGAELSAKRTPIGRSWNWNAWFYGLVPIAALGLALLAVVPRFYGPSADDRLGAEVIAAHVRSLMANHLTDIRNSNHHVVKPWFNGRLDFSPPVQDLSDHGFPLAGGRLEYLNGRPTAAIVYYRAAHPINLFVWPAKSGETSKEITFTQQGYHMIQWSGDGMTYWAISDLNERELKNFVELLRSHG